MLVAKYSRGWGENIGLPRRGLLVSVRCCLQHFRLLPSCVNRFVLKCTADTTDELVNSASVSMEPTWGIRKRKNIPHLTSNQPLLLSLRRQDGFKVSIFAQQSQWIQSDTKVHCVTMPRYGQTGSGKTYTMQGSPGPGALGHRPTSFLSLNCTMIVAS